jgi:diacylglycerol kinase
MDSKNHHYKEIEPVKYDRKKHNISFKNALNGVLLAFRTQPNFRFHLLFFVLFNIASFVYCISYFEYLILFLASGCVFGAEMFNSAIEAIGDEQTNGQYAKLIGVAKDISAGAVLLLVTFTFLLGSIVFIPKFFDAVVILVPMIY